MTTQIERIAEGIDLLRAAGSTYLCAEHDRVWATGATVRPLSATYRRLRALRWFYDRDAGEWSSWT